MRNTKTATILFSGLLAILAPLSGFSQEPSRTAQSATAKLQVTQCALKVSGMTCGGCAGMVEKSLLKLDGVTTAKVDYKTGEARVEFNSKNDDAGENCCRVQPGEFWFSSRTIEAWWKLAGNSAERAGARRLLCLTVVL